MEEKITTIAKEARKEISLASTSESLEKVELNIWAAGPFLNKSLKRDRANCLLIKEVKSEKNKPSEKGITSGAQEKQKS